MSKLIRLSERDLTNIIRKVMEEDHQNRSTRYMFFQNLKQMKRQCELLLDLDENLVTQILDDGHDWADDHITESKNNLDQVFDFMMNEIRGENPYDEEIEVMEEGRKKTGTKLCARGKSAAKAKYDVYPSAYANGYAVQVCKGKQPGLDGKKRCSGVYC